MKVVLLQDVKKLGKKGDIIEVSEGYGRNFLLPRKLAAPGTSGNINDAKQKKAAADDSCPRWGRWKDFWRYYGENNQ